MVFHSSISFLSVHESVYAITFYYPCLSCHFFHVFTCSSYFEDYLLFYEPSRTDCFSSKTRKDERIHWGIAQTTCAFVCLFYIIVRLKTFSQQVKPFDSLEIYRFVQSYSPSMSQTRNTTIVVLKQTLQSQH